MSKFKTMIDEIEPEKTPTGATYTATPTNPPQPRRKLRLVGVALISLIVGILASLSYLFIVAKDVKLRTPIQSPLYFEAETAPVPLNQHHPKEPSRQ